MFGLSLATFLDLLPGAIVGGVCFLCYLGGKHGWAWVGAWLKARAEKAKATVSAAESRFTTLEADVKAIKAKLGM